MRATSHSTPPIVSTASVLAVMPTLQRVTVRTVRAALGNRGSMRDIGRVLREVRKTPAEQLREALAHKEKPPGDAIVDALRVMESRLAEQLRQLDLQRHHLSGHGTATATPDVRAELQRLRALIDQRLPAPAPAIPNGDDERAMQQRLTALLTPWLARIEGALAKQPAIAAIDHLAQRIQALEQTVRQRDLELPAELRQLQSQVQTLGHQVDAGTQQIETRIAAVVDTLKSNREAVAALGVRVANAHHDLVERHAHHARRLADSDTNRGRESAQLHQHLAAVRSDVVTTAKAHQTEQRGQQTRLRRTLRNVALTQLSVAAVTAATLSRPHAAATKSQPRKRRRALPAGKRDKPATRHSNPTNTKALKQARAPSRRKRMAK